jgi:methionine-rich copper-binding protein CopC
MSLSRFTVPERISITRLFGIFLAISPLAHVGPVFAHAIVVESTPTINAEVSGPDIHFDLRFNSRVDHARSSLVISDAAEHKIHVPVADDAPPDHLLATAKNVAPGKCVLEWRVLSADGHLTRGLLPFTVIAP